MTGEPEDELESDQSSYDDLENEEKEKNENGKPHIGGKRAFS